MLNAWKQAEFLGVVYNDSVGKLVIFYIILFPMQIHADESAIDCLTKNILL